MNQGSTLLAEFELSASALELFQGMGQGNWVPYLYTLCAFFDGELAAAVITRAAPPFESKRPASRL